MIICILMRIVQVITEVDIVSDSDRTKGKAYIRTGKTLEQNDVLNDHIEFLLNVTLSICMV